MTKRKRQNKMYPICVLVSTKSDSCWYLLLCSVGPEFAWGKVPSSGQQAAAGPTQVEGPARGDRQGQPTVSERQQHHCKTCGSAALIRTCFSASVSEFSAVDPKASPELCTDCVTQPGCPTQPSSSTRSLSADGAFPEALGQIYLCFSHFCFSIFIVDMFGFQSASWILESLACGFSRLKALSHDVHKQVFIPLWLKT